MFCTLEAQRRLRTMMEMNRIRMMEKKVALRLKVAK